MNVLKKDLDQWASLVQVYRIIGNLNSAQTPARRNFEKFPQSQHTKAHHRNKVRL
jgi:hypothetical protein